MLTDKDKELIHLLKDVGLDEISVAGTMLNLSCSGADVQLMIDYINDNRDTINEEMIAIESVKMAIKAQEAQKVG